MEINVKKELLERNLPEFFENDNYEIKDFEKRRKEVLELFKKYEYGYFPNNNYEVDGFITEFYPLFGGSALYEKFTITFKDLDDNIRFAFPVQLVTPTNASKDNKVPLFLHFSFDKEITSLKYPVEEIADRNVAVATICYNDITNDNKNFDLGIAGLYKTKYSWGKIGMWAFAGSRALDFLLRDERFNKDKIASVGHSRLGKTSLWLGANDERVKYVFICQAGCSGDALSRGKSGEHIADITTNFPYWFSKEYKQFANNEENLPFEQYMLMDCCYPRKVYGSSAINDPWADPRSQFLCYLKAGEMYEKFGKKCITFDKDTLEVGDVFNDGYIGYHLSPYGHFLSRNDWNLYIDFLLK